MKEMDILSLAIYIYVNIFQMFCTPVMIIELIYLASYLIFY